MGDKSQEKSLRGMGASAGDRKRPKKKKKRQVKGQGMTQVWRLAGKGGTQALLSIPQASWGQGDAN